LLITSITLGATLVIPLIQHASAQQEFILYQPNWIAADGEAKSKRGLVGQVFKPENSGIIHEAQMILGTSGNGCRIFNLKLYEWLGDGDSSPENARGELLAEAFHNNICSSSGHPFPVNLTWPFIDENRIFLSKTSYYYFEIDYERRDVLSNFPNVIWGGINDGSLIDGKLWVTDDGIWYSPPPYAALQDLFLIIKGEIDTQLDPVIIVPGIMGSRLNRVSDGEEVWPNTNEKPQCANSCELAH